MLIRQGDVILRPIPAPKSTDGLGSKMPLSAVGDVVLAHGEVTGHAHRVRVLEAWVRADGSIVMRTQADGGAVQHEEHTAAPLQADEWYESWRQCQWTVEGGSIVAD